MKKLILFMSLLAMGLMVSAQTFEMKTFTADTLTDSDSGNLTSDAVYGLWTYSIQAVVVELSGAATITGLLQLSNNGTDWTTHPTADTLALTDDGSMLWAGALPGLYVRVNITQTGTATSSINGTVILKKPIIVD